MKGRSTEDDKLIGSRLRRIRRDLGLSQEELGEIWGITFQQVQKYENGTNRLSASRLLRFVHHFDVDITAFNVEDIDEETSLFLTSFRRLDAEKRRLLMDFVKTLSKRK